MSRRTSSGKSTSFSIGSSTTQYIYRRRSPTRTRRPSWWTACLTPLRRPPLHRLLHPQLPPRAPSKRQHLLQPLRIL